jgi:hypothetical protein
MRKLHDFPIVLVGRSYWEPFWAAVRQQALGGDLLDAGDLRLLSVADSPDKAAQCVKFAVRPRR